jgi:hypothetical protein
LRFPIVFNLTTNVIDTAIWAFTSNISGDIQIVTNRASKYGFGANQIRALLTFDGNALTLDAANSWTATQTFASIAVTRLATIDTLTVTREATVDTATISTSLTLSFATASTLVGLDANKNLITLATATYPSLTELSYVKGTTSAIQTQLNAKASLSGATFTGAVDFQGNLTVNAVTVDLTALPENTYTALSTDKIILIDNAHASGQINIGACEIEGNIVIIKDNGDGGAGTPSVISGGVNIDGAANRSIVTAYGRIVLFYTGSLWYIISSTL